ncbi:MAG TPA: N-acetylglucosamine transferase [Caulobacteraceae bacterium]|jgi:predicted O-linked N-acetylglucosamine transferase (SPINDLY family)
MPDNIFLTTLARITAGDLDLAELIDATAQLRDANATALAQQLYAVWSKFNADSPHTYAAYFNLSTLPGIEPTAAIKALEAAIVAKPDFWPAYINLGGFHERAGRLDLGVAQWMKVVEGLGDVTGPNIGYKQTALKQISRVLIDHQQSAAAEEHLQVCLGIDSGQRDALEQYFGLRLSQCRWPIVQPWDGAERRALMEGISPLTLAAFTDDPVLQMASAVRYVDATNAATFEAPAADRRDAPIDLSGRRLRVGYVSSDLRDHAVGYLMAEVFEAHPKDRIEVFAYDCGPPASGGMRDRYLAGVEHWRDLNGLSDDAAAALIAADGIDILVDVNGHTRFARTAVFARRPAPVIVNWLGYPGTMGSAFHQYIIGDDWVIPPEAEAYYTEKVLRLDCYQPNDRKRVVAEERPTRASAGLPDDAFVFCCFNGSQKITRYTFVRWLEILQRTENSVLWLLGSDDGTQARLREYAGAVGVDPTRIVFADKLANPYHLARYPLADLFLDTAPYGAHTTASDALWMGVPVLTLSGRGFAARVCGSLVRSAGLPELIVESSADYVARAVALAGDPAAIADYKARLAASRDSCVLFDVDNLMARLEQLYRLMALEHQAGRAPQPDLRNMPLYLKAGVEHDPDAGELELAGDYHGAYRGLFARLHRTRPIPPDSRLWTEADIAAAEGRTTPERRGRGAKRA